MPDTDPLSVLRRPVRAIAPDPGFTESLRAHIRARLRPTQGVPMTDTETHSETVTHSDAVSVGVGDDAAAQERVSRPGALPYLAVRGAAAAIEFYRVALGAELIGDPYVMDDARIGHAELALGGGVIYLADEFPDIGVVAPLPDGSGGASVSLMIAVEDTDAGLERWRAAGGRVLREASDNYGARGATVLDPFGHRWMLSGPVTATVPSAVPEPPQDEIRPGDLGYVSWWTPDAARAAAFYSRLLDWPADTGSGSGHTRRTSIPTGIDGGHEESSLFCCYAVADVDTASTAVRQAGGQADEPTEEAFGRSAMCTDPQGLRFAVYAPAPGTPRPAINGERAGDLEYVTYRVPESAGFREFYGAVFGWSFTPGHAADGWEPADAAPMSGVSGGAGRAVIVPMWRVDDVEASAEVVAAAGGRVIEGPSRQPYGMSALCEDDQGGRFYLGDG